MKSINFELQHILKRNEPIGSTNLIKATQSFHSRNETANKPTQTNEYYNTEEEKQLINFIQQHHLFIEFAINENNFIAAGAEQRVCHFNEKFGCKIE